MTQGGGAPRISVQRAVRGFRVCQKGVDKEVCGAAALVAELQRRLEEQGEEVINWDKVMQNLDKVEERLQGLKRKVENAAAESEINMASAVQRAEFASTLANAQCETNTEEKAKLAAKCRELLIADHLMRRGMTQSGRALARLRGLEQLVDGDLFSQVSAIAADICVNRTVTSALEWCADNRSLLKRVASDLEFKLHRTAFLCLVQNGDCVVAIEYARKNLSTFANERLREIQEAVAQLAFYRPDVQAGNRKKASPIERNEEHGAEALKAKRRKVEGQQARDATDAADVEMGLAKQTSSVETESETATGELISKQHWEELANQFSRDSERALSLQQQTALQATVKAGLASLHTHACSSSLSSRFRKSAQTGAFNTSSFSQGRSVEAANLMQQHADSLGDLGSSESDSPKATTNPDRAVASVACPRSASSDVHLLESARKALNCPCCTESLGGLAGHLPIANATQSKILCRLSGQILNEHNVPVVFPNGQVFSKQALCELAEDAHLKGSTVFCPIAIQAPVEPGVPPSHSATEERPQFQLEELRRIYIA